MRTYKMSKKALGNMRRGGVIDPIENKTKIGIAELNGKVILNFGENLSWMGLTWIGLSKDDCEEIGEILIKKSKK